MSPREPVRKPNGMNRHIGIVPSNPGTPVTQLSTPAPTRCLNHQGFTGSHRGLPSLCLTNRLLYMRPGQIVSALKRELHRRGLGWHVEECGSFIHLRLSQSNYWSRSSCQQLDAAPRTISLAAVKMHVSIPLCMSQCDSEALVALTTGGNT